MKIILTALVFMSSISAFAGEGAIGYKLQIGYAETKNGFSAHVTAKTLAAGKAEMVAKCDGHLGAASILGRQIWNEFDVLGAICFVGSPEQSMLPYKIMTHSYNVRYARAEFADERELDPEKTAPEVAKAKAELRQRCKASGGLVGVSVNLDRTYIPGEPDTELLNYNSRTVATVCFYKK